jgi:hypothetical protein
MADLETDAGSSVIFERTMPSEFLPLVLFRPVEGKIDCAVWMELEQAATWARVHVGCGGRKRTTARVSGVLIYELG